MLTSQGRSALIAGVLLIVAVAVAHGRGQEREPSGGHRIPSTFGAKVVTEHVPVLPIPERWNVEPRPKQTDEVAARMGFRAARRKAQKAEPAAAKPSVSTPAPAPKPVLPTDPHFRAGRACLAAADYAGAVEPFRASVRSAPEDGDPRLGLAFALVATGADERAARSFRQAVRCEPALLDRVVEPASGFRDAAEFDRVVGALEKRAAVEPGSADAKFCLAVLRLLRGDERCRATFTWLVVVTPKDEAAVLCREAAGRRFAKKKDPTPDLDEARPKGEDE